MLNSTQAGTLQTVMALVLALGGGQAAQSVQPAQTGQVAEPPPARRGALIRMVRQDCGSCHGMRLTGGLGPALTPQALAGKPVDALAATIHAGRPGTPMPPWRAMLSAEEALWIAGQLLAGFPEDPPRSLR